MKISRSNFIALILLLLFTCGLVFSRKYVNRVIVKLRQPDEVYYKVREARLIDSIRSLNQRIKSDSAKIRKDVIISFSKTAAYKNLLSAVHELKQGYNCERILDLTSDEFSAVRNNFVKTEDSKTIFQIIKEIRSCNEKFGDNLTTYDIETIKGVILWLELTKLKVERTARFKLHSLQN